NDSYLFTVLRYIHNNPVDAGLTTAPDQYRWSSYNEYLKSHSLVDVDFILGAMSRDQFVHFHQQRDNNNFLDIKEDSFRMTDAEAKVILHEVSGAESTTAFPA
ncbi:MAG: Transposase like protein, partial [Sporomusa sp.]|nr:Transposase like protein [Sporomusa sp.]